MEIKTSSVNFGSFEGSGPRTTSANVIFSHNVTQAVAIMTGFKAAFSKSDGDHNLGNLDIRIRTDPPSGTSVNVNVTFGLRDWSGTWDDKYEGQVFFAVIGE
jgi:hypothetical protein